MGRDDLFESIFPSQQSVLKLVDEFTLYCFYTGIDPLVLSRAYNAPYRQDNVPSFTVYRSSKGDNEYMWKDHATGESGNIFKLIQKVEHLSTVSEAIARINEDFQLGYNLDSEQPREKIVLYKSPELNTIKISISSVPLTEKGRNFWYQFSISEELLSKYDTTQIQWYWSFEGQEVPHHVLDPTFAYEIGGFYQIYSPYAPRREKFRNDLPENYFFGYMQLPPKGDKLIIDKSMKDVIFCSRLGYNAVAGKSESTMIPHNKVLELKERFNEIYLMLDPDPAGRAQTEKYIALYPWMKPRFLSQAKDKTDLCKLVGFDEAQAIIKELID